MSSSPKYSHAELEQQQRERLEQERRRKAEEEARQRAEAAERERQRLLKLLSEAEQVIGEMEALITGLKADPVVIRWHLHSISELEANIQTAMQALKAEQFDKPAQIFATLKEQEKKIIAESNAAQLKAEQRDYIANSINQTLKEMGFTVVPPVDEHTNHPATAKILRATAAGRVISVSVPVEGQVWYDVDGYSKTTETGIDGKVANVCDEAEQVLLEMHTALQNEFGIKMGEISWKGKNPNRQLRTAQELPKGSEEKRGGS